MRVAKLDTDQYPQQATRLKIQGLPTLILFDASGQEVDRIEGALMKDQMMAWVESNIPSVAAANVDEN